MCHLVVPMPTVIIQLEASSGLAHQDILVIKPIVKMQFEAFSALAHQDISVMDLIGQV